jgi:hypothetical protein
MQKKLIKEKIQKETQRVFQNKSDFNVPLVIDTFLNILTYPLNKSELRLDGLETNVPSALNKLLVTESSKSDTHLLFPAFAKVEPFIRKICYLLYPQKYLEMESNKVGLGGFINYLKLNPDNIDFDNTTANQLISSTNYGEHLLRTYKLRNIESHQSESWTSRELYENIESVLVIYLYVTNKFLIQLKPILDSVSDEKEPDFTVYLESVKANFKNRLGRFVHLKGREDINITQGFVVENIADQSDERVERKGTVNDLRKTKIPERRMIIWGDAGMGKSTTLEFMAYIDADEKLRIPNSKLPIYIPLGLLTDKSISLKQSIFSKIGVEADLGEKMLIEGRINLFLDAVNEIPRDEQNQLKTIRQREIDNLITDYKKTFIIISNRPQDENNFKGLPVFQLQKMDKDQIELFINKNSEGNKIIANKILTEIKNDERLEKIIKTPLMLSRLIEIVKLKGEIPKSEGEIIDRFIFSLYQREKVEKKDGNFDTKKIHRLLRSLGYESLEKKDTNSGMNEDEILNYFVECKKKYGFEMDTIYVLDIATQLGILEKRDDMYTFAHQAYQDYFHALEEKAILGI